MGSHGISGSRWCDAIRTKRNRSPAPGAAPGQQSSQLSLELRIIERISEVKAEEWNALVHVDSSPFVEHAWLDCLEEAGCVGGRTGWLPRHLVLYDGKKVVAAAPAYLKM